MKNKLIKILRWPENKTTGLKPWFFILWRLLFLPIYATALILCTLSLFAMYGYSVADNFWKQNV